MAVAPVSSAASQGTGAPFGLEFESLLKIILTQLTYQDPLKPVDNFQFVSQLAQFSQLQQSQALNDQITSLLASQAAGQATSLLGRRVDLLGNSTTTVSGVVEAVSFASGQPTLTIRTDGDEIIGNISIADVSQVRVEPEEE
jgi:flagellar basal-body rod modification protein FlgD